MADTWMEITNPIRNPGERHLAVESYSQGNWSDIR